MRYLKLSLPERLPFLSWSVSVLDKFFYTLLPLQLPLAVSNQKLKIVLKDIAISDMFNVKKTLVLTICVISEIVFAGEALFLIF